jgi:hypothetical protein
LAQVECLCRPHAYAAVAEMGLPDGLSWLALSA